MRVLAVLVLCAVAVSAIGVDKPKVAPRIYGKGEYLPKSRVITYPKGQLPASVVDQAAEAAAIEAKRADGTLWLSPAVNLVPVLQAATGGVCTPSATNVRASGSTSASIVFTTTVGERLTITSQSETSANGYTWIPVSGRGKKGFVAKTLVGPCATTPTVTPANSKFPLYKQCGQSWSSQQLGSCSGTTICKAGCAMSSVAMILRSRGVDTDPGKLNTWMRANGGYSGCAIYWAKADIYGGRKTSCQGQQGRVSYATLCSQVRAGFGVVLNVNNGGHWVLLTGCQGADVLLVNDPGYNRSSYPYSMVVGSVLYK